LPWKSQTWTVLSVDDDDLERIVAVDIGERHTARPVHRANTTVCGQFGIGIRVTSGPVQPARGQDIARDIAPARASRSG